MSPSKKKDGFTAEEKAAMRARAKEVKAAADGESAVREALAAMTPHDRKIGKRIHAIVKEAAPELIPKTWYGMPAYANKDGKVLVFFRNAEKFKERYAMLSFNDSANLDDGPMWPVAFAVKELTKNDEAKIRAFVKQAVGGEERDHRHHPERARDPRRAALRRAARARLLASGPIRS
jgi:hypothetical protein